MFQNNNCQVHFLDFSETKGIKLNPFKYMDKFFQQYDSKKATSDSFETGDDTMNQKTLNFRGIVMTFL